MARPRKPPTPRSARTKRDNARARKLGYKSYYDYRIHDNGRVPPGRAVPAGQRSRLRGHGVDRWRRHGQAAQMLRVIDAETTVSLTQPVSQILRRADGVYPEIEKLLIGGDGMGRTFTIRDVTRKQLVALIEEEIRRGAQFVKAPSFDQRRLVSDDEIEGGY
jgi:hypothetical protein